MWLCLQNKSSHQVPESCGHLPTIGIPKAIYHYMTNTTKQQPTYQLFQNIMRQKNQLVNPPKMTKFTSICAFSQFLLQICSYFWPLKLGQWANQSGSRCHMTCKMAGECTHPGPPGGASADIGMLEGLTHFYVMQNTDNLYFPRAIQ